MTAPKVANNISELIGAAPAGLGRVGPAAAAATSHSLARAGPPAQTSWPVGGIAADSDLPHAGVHGSAGAVN